MKTKIAIPDNPIFDKLVANAEEVSKAFDYELIKIPESQLDRYFLNNRFDVALISPMTYAKCVTKGDYRIIPGPALFAEGYTGLVSMYFNPDLTTINSFTVTDKDDYLMLMAKILLAERYGILGNLVESKKDLFKDLKEFDAAFVYGKPLDIRSMDLSEDWTDQFNISLPIAFWCVKNEEEPINVVEAVHRFAEENIKPELYTKEKVAKGEFDYNRRGKIIYRWADYLEKDVDDTLELLYHHLISPEIASVKLVASSAIKTDTGEKIYTDDEDTGQGENIE